MRTVRYETKKLKSLFHKNKILTLDLIKQGLGTSVKMTVLRKLKPMRYRSSYSHKGGYYTLDEIAQFNEYGIWTHNRVHFSNNGTLMDTIFHLVDTSEQGYFASELMSILKVRVQEAIFKLYELKKIGRCKIGGVYLYFSRADGVQQRKKRKLLIKSSENEKKLLLVPHYDSPNIRRCLTVFLSTLNEKQRRLFVGLESMKIDTNGDGIMAEISGMHPQTVAKGRKELLFHDITPDRIRKEGGGRNGIKKN